MAPMQTVASCSISLDVEQAEVAIFHGNPHQADPAVVVQVGQGRPLIHCGLQRTVFVNPGVVVSMSVRH